MLKSNQLHSLKSTLTKRKAEITEELDTNEFDLQRSHDHEVMGELSNYDNHPADTGTDLFEREKDIALNEHLEYEFQEIKHALNRIDEGTYGTCEQCEKDIPLERLEAIPYTRYCKEHTKDRTVSRSRPIEEGVLLPAYGKFEYDEKDSTFFDAEDSWQAVQVYGTSETPSDFADRNMADYNDMINEEDESISFVEELESFIGTDIDGKNMKVYPNAIHQKYEERLDEEDAMSVTGNLGATEIDTYGEEQ